MARARNLKPSFFLNTELAKIEPLGRILFAGLWCLADREGRLEDNSIKIKAQLLPYDNADVDNLLTLLHNVKLIMRYKKRSDKYIQIINFTKHQYPHIREPKSTIPAPYKHSAETVPDLPYPPSPIPHTEITTPLPGGESSQPSTDPNQNNTPFDCQKYFEKVWSYYPRRLGKKTAFRHFKASIKNEENLKRLIISLENYLAYIEEKKIEEKFIQHGSTWFNNWEDWAMQGGKA